MGPGSGHNLEMPVTEKHVHCKKPCKQHLSLDYHAEYRGYAPAPAADQKQEINFVWPKIVPGRRRCPVEEVLISQSKGGFIVHAVSNYWIKCTWDILIINLTTNPLRPAMTSPTSFWSQNTDASQDCSCMSKNLTKWRTSAHEGSRKPHELRGRWKEEMRWKEVRRAQVRSEGVCFCTYLAHFETILMLVDFDVQNLESTPNWHKIHSLFLMMTDVSFCQICHEERYQISIWCL